MDKYISIKLRFPIPYHTQHLPSIQNRHLFILHSKSMLFVKKKSIKRESSQANKIVLLVPELFVRIKYKRIGTTSCLYGRICRATRLEIRMSYCIMLSHSIQYILCNFIRLPFYVSVPFNSFDLIALRIHYLLLIRQNTNKESRGYIICIGFG